MNRNEFNLGKSFDLKNPGTKVFIEDGNIEKPKLDIEEYYFDSREI